MRDVESGVGGLIDHRLLKYLTFTITHNFKNLKKFKFKELLGIVKLGVGRWLRGKCLLCKNGNLSLWYPHKKLGMVAHGFNPVAEWDQK